MTETKDTSLAAAIREAAGGAILVMIPVDKIRPNEKNFYEMSDLDTLAASIDQNGQLDPVKVRADGDGYTIIDGERRFRAMTELLGRDAVQCRIMKPENEIAEELILIESNRTQRKMTSADLSKQAERYTELLSQLKDSGMRISGRLRDRVAEALQVSSTKLARLHAIRENSVPRALALFDDGTLNESAAYSLQQLPEEHQTLLAETMAVAGKGLGEYDVRDLDGYLQKFDKATCEDGQACQHIQERLTMMNSQNSWTRCCTGCCKTCYKLDSCRAACPKMAETVAKKKAEAKAARADAKAAQAKEDARLKKIADDDWARIKALRERQGVDLDAVHDTRHYLLSYDKYESRNDVAYPAWTVRDWLSGYKEIDKLAALADILGVTMDEVLGRTPKGVSGSDQKPAGIVWHNTQEEGPPSADALRIICWGEAGLYKPLPHLLEQEFDTFPENCRWWATVDGPKEVAE